MNPTMSDDIPQDQVEAVAKAALEAIRNNIARPMYNEVGIALQVAIAAIRVLTPMIAAVERERCAMLVYRATTSKSFYDDDPVNVAFTDAFNSGSARTSVSNRIDAAGRALCAEIRSVKGAADPGKAAGSLVNEEQHG